MNRLVSLLAGAAVVAALRADARACDPVGQIPHTVDASMQAADQTPPTLPAIPPPIIHRGDGSQGCTRSDCASLGSIQIAAGATDDMSTPDKIGYRFSLAAGALPSGFTLPTTAIDPLGARLLMYFDADKVGAMDFTLQVAAIDLAGNESAPQTVRVTDDSGMACAVARASASRNGFAVIAVVALLLAARRRRRSSR